METGNKRAKKSFFIFIVIISICCTSLTKAVVIYADVNATGSNNGSSWEDAYTSLQSALSAAVSDDEIWVAAGTYTPTTGTDRTISFVTKEDVAIYGGFVGTEISRDQRDWVTNQTVLSGDINAPGDNSDNSYHVVVGVTDATLDGFTITGGNANGGGDDDNSGGMTTPWFSSPIVTNCTFINNSAKYLAGGMGSYDGGAVVTNCTFIGNTAERGGGMLNNHYSNLIVTDCTFIGNTATDDGGGMWNGYQSNPIVTNCTFINNSANYGGGIRNYYIIVGAPKIINCTFSGNSANDGGGVYNWDSYASFANCTFSGNTADANGGGMYNYNRNVTVINSIFWGNAAPNEPQISGTPSADVSYSDIQGGFGGTGNINANPLFVGPNDLHLQVGSPCIDAGDNNSVPADTPDLDGDGNTIEPIPFDMDGSPRFQDGNGDGQTVVDMGAFERKQRVATPTFEPDEGWYMSAIEVVISCATAEATIHYTTNGLDPTPADPCVESGGTVLITKPTTLKARAFREEWESSEVKTGIYYLPVTFYVSTTGSDDNNGLSWVTAKRTIQAAIDVSYYYGDTILVADGIYTGQGNRDISTNKGVTVRSENGPNNCIIDCNGTEAEPHRGFYFEGSDRTDFIVIDGFTIKNGYATMGGGMWNGLFSNPTVANCVFINNTATEDGGGMYNWDNSNPTLTNCIFSNNTGTNNGGGMRNENNSNPTMTNCTFSSNMAGAGAGICNDNYSNPIVTNCVFIGNTAYGGGMYNDNYSSPIVTNCTFLNNTSTFNGGGMYNDGSSPIVTNCAFSGNTATRWGGGMYNVEGSNPIITDCTFKGNMAGLSGGGMFNYMSSSSIITNCIFSGNTANSGGGMYYRYSGNVVVTNCTFTGNSANNIGGIGNYSTGSGSSVTNCIFWNNFGGQIGNGPGVPITIINYNDIQGGRAGTGNINADPCFVEPGHWGDVNDPNTVVEPDDPNAIWVEGNYRLLWNSPCIDAGDNNSVPADYADLDGDGNTVEPTPLDLNGFLRFIDDLLTEDTGNGTPPIVDMGAYEFLRSDIDSSGGVDLEDLALLSLRWLESGCGRCGGADLTGDGQVDWDDLQELTEWWLAGTSN